MAEIDRISELFQRVYGGSSWHGPSLRDLLSDVSAEEAGARLVPGAHTIGQLTRHIIAWQNFATRALRGEVPGDPPASESWPDPAELTPEGWQRTRDELRGSQRDFRLALERFEPPRLQELVPDRAYRFDQLLYGVIHHNLYHAGQIALLKKAWTATRA